MRCETPLSNWIGLHGAIDADNFHRHARFNDGALPSSPHRISGHASVLRCSGGRRHRTRHLVHFHGYRTLHPSGTHGADAASLGPSADASRVFDGGLGIRHRCRFPRAKVHAIHWLVAVSVLVLFFPANIYAAINHIPMGGHARGPVYLLIRAPLQVIILSWVYWFTIRQPNTALHAEAPQATRR